jgi:hypothetical protein
MLLKPRNRPRHVTLIGAGLLALCLSTVTGWSGAAATVAGPNAATSAAVHTGSTRTIAASGQGRMQYTGTVDVASLPQISAAQAVATGNGHAALKVPGWFKGPDVGATQRKTTTAGPLVTTPTFVHLNKAGTAQSQASCNCQPPDTNGAISSTRIVEAVNLSMTIYLRGGALVRRTSLASFFPTSRRISDPHILFDNAAKRWILVFIPVPETTSTTPQMYLAVSTTADPGGTWFKYTMSFGGGLYPPGTLLDYPMVGQDRNAIIVGSNNFQFNGSGFNYINSSVFAINKAAAYSGSGFSFPAFAVAFSTHPAVARGVPQKSYARSYLLAANSGGGYTLYYLTNTAGTPSLTLQGTSANALWSPPPPATQPPPNNAVRLDTLDGRIQSPPMQADTFLWFTHAVNLSGFPAVRYGAISLASSGLGGLSVTSAYAFATSTSNDWNPSLALAEPATNSVRIFLNWAVNDPAAGRNVGQRVSGVGPGEGVPSLAGIGTTLFTGGGSPSQTRFGDYSSTTMDVKNLTTTCLKNTQALVVNQVFRNGTWQVRLARVGTC